MEEVQALCTRIGIMDSGRIVACDTLPNLLRLKDGFVRFRIASLTPALRQHLAALCFEPGRAETHQHLTNLDQVALTRPNPRSLGRRASSRGTERRTGWPCAPDLSRRQWNDAASGGVVA